MLALLLATSQALLPLLSDETPSKSRVCFADPRSVGLAPIPIPAPAGLPEAHNVADGILLPPPLGAEALRVAECYAAWPEACQVTLDEQRTYYEVRLRFEAEAQKRIVDTLTEARGGSSWPDWIVAILGAAGGAVVGIASGMIVGYAVGVQHGR